MIIFLIISLKFHTPRLRAERRTFPVDNERPVRQSLRRQPLTKRNAEREEVQKMVEKEVTEPSTSAWASYLVLVIKPNGATRVCVDYRTLNAKTTRNAYPLPRFDECLETLSGA